MARHTCTCICICTCICTCQAEAARRPERAAYTQPLLTTYYQVLLDDVNNSDPAQEEAFRIFRDNTTEYQRRVKLQVARTRQIFAN